MARDLPEGSHVVKEPRNVYLFTMRVTLNGEARDLSEGLTVNDLVDALGLGKRRVAVEVNRDILPRDDYATYALQEGDVVEIVQFIGGG